MENTRMTREQLFKRFQTFYLQNDRIGLSVDVSRMNFSDEILSKINRKTERAIKFMAQLEKGAIANPSENRMVGHYWLRSPHLAPDRAIGEEILSTIDKVKKFAAKIHNGEILSSNGKKFINLLVIGIGGSILGPQFVSRALGNPLTDKMKVYFIDNTDPDGIDRTLQYLDNQLDTTLCVVISKSGKTIETRNAMLEVEHRFNTKNIPFPKHSVAITQMVEEKSELYKKAKNEGWLEVFPMWDWVGGRTSETSAVGLLPAALQGFDIDKLLEGASLCDEWTRTKEARKNPSAMLAIMWWYAGNGKGEKNMVILPYKDRLELFSRYLQQLVMESLGKEYDLAGKQVNQGLTVYGNKGSTDQHAYIQQLRDGRNDFFVTFIEVLKDRYGEEFFVEPDVTSGDYLLGFYLGTRRALYEKERESITITLTEISPLTIGALIALFERAVGLYAHMININAYDQPGVEAGKVAAGEIIDLQKRILKFLTERPEKSYMPIEIAQNIISQKEIETGLKPEDLQEDIYKICDHLSANPNRGIEKIASAVLNATAFRYLPRIE
jgi:glucose-6-phosphate isomerase